MQFEICGRTFAIEIRQVTSAVIIAASLATISWSLDSDSNIDKQCPDAVRERASLVRSHPRDVAVVSRPALQKLLMRMVQRDQEARSNYIPVMLGEPAEDDPRLVRLKQVDAENLVPLRHIVVQDGFPTVAMVGLSGVDAAFLIAQHADEDPALQERILRTIAKRWKSGGFDAGAYALLTDRVFRARNMPQLYGTQFEKRDGKWVPQPIADESHVDARRREIGLISLENYTCIIQAVYNTGVAAEIDQ